MPQLIAMIIVVVGAMIYMFQTFGGTGDKIEGVAQKGSIITEINNIKDGVKIAAKSGHIEDTPSATTDAVTNLAGLATLSYFAEQINEQVKANADTNAYYAISFGGQKDDSKPAMIVRLVPSEKVGTVKMIPGIYVDFSTATGSLYENRAFLEAQVAKDLESIAYIDRAAVSAVAKDAARGTTTELDKRTPANTDVPDATTLADGKFIIYFKDFGADEVVQ